jgi:phosphopantetheinyl transferase
MPLLKEWAPDAFSLAAIWHIEEEESFFQVNTGLTPSIRHPRRRIEHLAGRFLLQHLREDFPLFHIAPDEHDKPRIPEDQYLFNVSHSYPFVAAVLSDHEECGIDIQVWHKDMNRIVHMFLSEQEKVVCRQDAAIYNLAWSLKEAVYKWNGRRGADFIRDFPIQKLDEQIINNPNQCFEREFIVEMDCMGKLVQPKGFLFKDFSLAYIVKDIPDRIK